MQISITLGNGFPLKKFEGQHINFTFVGIGQLKTK